MFDEVVDKILVYADEFPRKNSSSVHVRCVGFEGFVVAQNLTRACSRHGGNQEAVSDSMSK